MLERFHAGLGAGQQLLGLIRPPGLMSHATKREPHVPNLTVRYFERGRQTHECERKTGAVAHFPVLRIFRELQRGKLNRSNQFIWAESGLRLRRVSRKPVESLEGDRPLAAWTFHV